MKKTFTIAVSLIFILVLNLPVEAKSKACPAANYLSHKLSKNYLLRFEMPSGVQKSYNLKIKKIDHDTGKFSYDLFLEGNGKVVNNGVGKIQFKFFRFTVPIVEGDKLLAVYDCNGVLNNDGTVLSKCIVIERKLRDTPICNKLPTVELIAIS